MLRSFFAPYGLLVVALLAALDARAEDASYAVIIDDDLPIYRTVVTGIAVESRAPLDEHSLGGDATRGPDVMKEALAKNPRVIVAVGPKAANAAKKSTAKVPIVYCMVPRPEDYPLSGPRIVGVRLEQSFALQLSALKALLPEVTRVAVVHDPSRSRRTFSLARREAEKQGLELVPVEIASPAETQAALENGAGSAQALWMISDPTVLNLQSFEAMLAFAEAKRLPFFALNAGFVERGALLSFSLDYARMGRQVGRIANRLAESDAEQKPGLFSPEGADLALNLRAAERLGNAEALYARLLAYAAEHKHGVRVFR